MAVVKNEATFLSTQLQLNENNYYEALNKIQKDEE